VFDDHKAVFDVHNVKLLILSKVGLVMFEAKNVPAVWRVYVGFFVLMPTRLFELMQIADVP